MGPVFAETILVVDDIPGNIDILAGILSPHYRVVFATDGTGALRLARGDPAPGLILLDVVMPGMGGHEVCRRLKADPLTRGIPVIFITAKAGESDEEQGLALGAVDYLRKSSHPAIVRQRVRIHLDLRSQNSPWKPASRSAPGSCGRPGWRSCAAWGGPANTATMKPGCMSSA